jgi:hypothetical protein
MISRRRNVDRPERQIFIGLSSLPYPNGTCGADYSKLRKGGIELLFRKYADSTPVVGGRTTVINYQAIRLFFLMFRKP